MKQYAIIEDTGTYIQCLGVYPFYEGIGHLVAEARNACLEWEDNNYELTDSEEFFKLEADTGWGWMWDYKSPNGAVISERWYLLEVSGNILSCLGGG